MLLSDRQAYDSMLTFGAVLDPSSALLALDCQGLECAAAAAIHAQMAARWLRAGRTFTQSMASPDAASNVLRVVSSHYSHRLANRELPADDRAAAAFLFLFSWSHCVSLFFTNRHTHTT